MTDMPAPNDDPERNDLCQTEQCAGQHPKWAHNDGVDFAVPTRCMVSECDCPGYVPLVGS